MLGLGNSKDDVPAGAKDKLAIAKQMREAGRYNINQQGGGDVKYPSQVAIVAVIYVLSTLLAMLLSDSGSNPLSNLNLTGIHTVDDLIGGNSIMNFTGDPDQDRLITILGRGFAFFVVTGIIPLVSMGLEKLLFYKRVWPLLICWGVIVVALLFNLCIPVKEIVPFFKDLWHGLIG